MKHFTQTAKEQLTNAGKGRAIEVFCMKRHYPYFKILQDFQ
jgi:hypothetical protein